MQGDGNKMLSEAAASKALGGTIYRDPANNFIAVFSEELFIKIKNFISGNAKILNVTYVPREWKLILEENRQKKLRRRVEDALRKTATEEQLNEIAHILGVKTE